jgi:hypothetical protein
MDATVRARFFRVSEKPDEAADLPDLLLAETKKSLSDRERNVSGTTQEDNEPGVMLRLEECETEGEFVTGQFCRKQTINIPPQAGPDGLAPITLADGQGIGHLSAFRYHRPTRVILLQNNIQCASPRRIQLYAASINPAALYGFSPIMRQDALERFKHRQVRSFTVGFASPENLEALDDKGIASARGARMLAEAFHGLNLTITVSVGKKRKSFLDFDAVSNEIKALLGSDANVSQLEVSANEDEEGSNIDFIQEHLRCKEISRLAVLQCGGRSAR